MANFSSSRSQGTARILMVDDNSMGLMARKTVLEDQGYVVVSVGCPEEALTKLRTEHFDVLVSDYKMPSMSGIELIRQVRDIDRPVLAILLSGFAEPLGLDQNNTGADAVIQKNANEVPHLLSTLHTLLRVRRRPVKSERPPSTRPRRKSG